MNTQRTVMMFAILFLAACASAPPLVDQDAVNYMINIDRNGNFVPIVADERIDLSSKESQRDQTIQAALDKEEEPDLLQASGLGEHWQAMESALRKHAAEHGGQVNLLLYLHGG